MEVLVTITRPNPTDLLWLAYTYASDEIATKIEEYMDLGEIEKAQICLLGVLDASFASGKFSDGELKAAYAKLALDPEITRQMRQDTNCL